MTTYYVSSVTGSDANDGASTGAPWKTITKVNAACASGQVGARDVVCFARGETFYGQLVPVALSAGALTLTSYGTAGDARRPIITSYKLLNNPSGWTQIDGTTWKITLSTANAGTVYTGYDDAQGGGGDIGFLKVNGTIYGQRRWNQVDLAAAWDFYCNGDDLYVRATANPTTLAADIRAAPDGRGIVMTSGLRVEGLQVQGCGGHGIQGTASRVRVAGCRFLELGGSQLGSSGTTRYGNGIEAFIGSNTLTFEGNTFAHIYDTAYTLQGSVNGNLIGFRDTVFRRNFMYRCNQAIEFWSGGTAPTGGFSNCVATENVSLFAGQGWAGTVRPDQNVNVQLLTYGWTLPADITVAGNVFFDGAVGYRYSSTTPTGMTCTNNVIALPAGRLIHYQRSETIEQSATWTAAVGNDLDSTFAVAPAGTTTVEGALSWLRAQYPSRPIPRHRLSRISVAGVDRLVALP